MFWETLERVNRLRQQALASSEFVESAKDHELALREQDFNSNSKCPFTKQGQGKKSLADIYKEVDFGDKAPY
ncbi:hypothetical protein BS333_06435 [Vibrio azureus]|uniref:Uncharacterized protein n=1 Tax=Vibrio azureus NBRC 104587 TaxID=1219077 RepID=U3AN23_9VIBR|nr:hypothetical protein [Vibrio azureus]AUI86049.1 hypothetical protein BS333_06435 [Vibrio azureus]GAD74697.1 hypothetical protein VAZ01S_013_01050 [Vibrio azureus NBRC 104587]